jgi:hypothetical protein
MGRDMMHTRTNVIALSISDDFRNHISDMAEGDLSEETRKHISVLEGLLDGRDYLHEGQHFNLYEWDSNWDSEEWGPLVDALQALEGEIPDEKNASWVLRYVYIDEDGDTTSDSWHGDAGDDDEFYLFEAPSITYTGMRRREDETSDKPAPAPAKAGKPNKPAVVDVGILAKDVFDSFMKKPELFKLLGEQISFLLGAVLNHNVLELDNTDVSERAFIACLREVFPQGHPVWLHVEENGIPF